MKKMYRTVAYGPQHHNGSNTPIELAVYGTFTENRSTENSVNRLYVLETA